MTDDQINDQAFKLIELVKVQKLPEQEPGYLDAIKGVPLIASLGEVENAIFTQEDEDGNTASIQLNVNEEEVGFNKADYIHVRQLTEEVLSKEDIYLLATPQFIERKIFDWAIEVYKEKKANTNFLTYLYQKIEAEADHYHFYFSLEALGIEENFNVGIVTILVFTEKALNDEYEIIRTTTDIPKDRYEKSFSKFKDKPLAHIIVYGTYDKAKQIAKQEVALTINAVKCFLTNQSLLKHIQLLDVDFLSRSTKTSRCLSRKNNNRSTYRISSERTTGATPTIIDSKVLTKMNRFGLGKISAFLRYKKDSELYFKTEQLIQILGDAFSTRDFHERSVKLISFFESIIVPETEGRAKGLTIIKKQILPKLLPKDNDRERILSIFISFYAIRDKYLHNRRILTVNFKELHTFQCFAFYFLMHTVDLNKSINTMEEYFAHFEIPH